jgi:hypothetical protein
MKMTEIEKILNKIRNYLPYHINKIVKPNTNIHYLLILTSIIILDLENYYNTIEHKLDERDKFQLSKIINKLETLPSEVIRKILRNEF